MPKVTELDIVSNSSDISSMRWAFYQMVRLSIAFAILIGVAIFVNPFLPSKIDVGSLITLEGVILGSAFGGKAVQSFGEKVSQDTQTTTP